MGNGTSPTGRAWAERLRENVAVRHGPVTALLILLAVCVVCLALILRDFVALLTSAPLALAIVLYVRAVRRR